MGSEPSLGSPNPEHSSPPKIYSTRSPLLMDSPPKASHKGNPPCPFGSPLPTNLKAQRSISESSSGSSRVRTASESSITSVESVDIEFVSEDEVDRKCTGLNGNVLAENSEPNCVASPKYSNSVLALILGCDDSESEESDDELEDSDSDWDDVCVDSADNIILDDTWETFGLGLTISEAGKTQKSNAASELECTIRSPVKPICDTANEEDPTFTGVTLEDINKRWEEEIEKDVLGTSSRKVNFGEAIVHPMIVWSYAYKTSRMGPWEMYARDRMRFSHRIAALESVISPVLQADHREAFYQKQRGLACCLS
ncbi:phosphatase 1 regulatory subunit 15A-like [Homarus americanus]|uniref:Phosphatase 1 regulatory subunit 15A-like n=1 Tax=Homarus americanus TaxID=6706 RepID=A0A8J5K5K7_HOMAM|nr:phosphatase 1 regulatory subunit 15A-like [Homarus americanus]